MRKRAHECYPLLVQPFDAIVRSSHQTSVASARVRKAREPGYFRCGGSGNKIRNEVRLRRARPRHQPPARLRMVKLRSLLSAMPLALLLNPMGVPLITPVSVSLDFFRCMANIDGAIQWRHRSLRWPCSILSQWQSSDLIRLICPHYFASACNRDIHKYGCATSIKSLNVCVPVRAIRSFVISPMSKNGRRPCPDYPRGYGVAR